ncbi:hypothetical protein OS11_40540 [Dickeya oryzae]
MCQIWHIKGDPYLPPIAGAVPPSPARCSRFIFCASAETDPARARTGGKGINSIKKIVQNCA